MSENQPTVPAPSVPAPVSFPVPAPVVDGTEITLDVSLLRR